MLSLNVGDKLLYTPVFNGYKTKTICTVEKVERHEVELSWSIGKIKSKFTVSNNVIIKWSKMGTIVPYVDHKKLLTVELLDHMGNDNVVANVARVSMGCTDNWLDLPTGYSEDKRDSLVTYLAEHKHTSPFRHNAIQIRCKVPIFIARQLGKHQVGMSWNEVSRRYVDENFEFFQAQDTWRKRPDKSIKQGSAELLEEESQVKCNDWYENVLDTAMGAYEAMIDEGVAPEMARMVLPQSMMTEFIWTGSLMAFAHVYTLRIDGHAQKEAQDFAKSLDEVIRPLFPVSWAALVGK